MFKGNVSTELLKSVKTSEKMGIFKESHSCTSKFVYLYYIILDSDYSYQTKYTLYHIWTIQYFTCKSKIYKKQLNKKNE